MGDFSLTPEYLAVFGVAAGVAVAGGFAWWRASKRLKKSESIFTTPHFAYAELASEKTLHQPENIKAVLGEVPADETALLALFDAEAVKAWNGFTEKLLKGEVPPAIVIRSKQGQFIEFCALDTGKNAAGRYPIFIANVTQRQRRLIQVQAEAESLKSEVRRHSAILNGSQSLSWMRDSDLNIIYCNLAYTTAVEDISAESSDMGVPELHRNCRTLAANARSTGQPQYEKMHIVVGGERRLYDIREVYVRDIDMTVGYARDITDIEHMQEEIRQHISAEHDLLESSTSAVAIFGADTRLRFYNQAYVRMWKFEEQWLDTSPTFSEILEFLRERRRLPEQANVRADKEQMLRLFTDLLELKEDVFFLPDGKVIRNVAVPYATGGIVFSYEDVTDRVALEQSYNTLIAVQRETLDSLHEGVVVFGEDGRIRLSNPVFLRLWEMKENDLADRAHINEFLDKVRHFFRTEDADQFKKEMQGRIQSRRIQTSRMERADGTVVEWSTVPLPDGGTLVTFTDVTASTLVERSLREKNEALTAADKLKSEFLANMSYELRSPLTSISGFADMLSQDYFGPLTDKQREYVDGIRQSSQHLTQLIGDILDLASIEAGYLTLEVREFSIKDMLHAMLALLSERLREFGLQGSIDCPEDIGMMRGDETRIRQALFHLLSNAVKYTKEGYVTLGASRDSLGIRLWVRDTGVGIAPEEQQAVFEKFYRGAAGSSKSGTGLGLSMVKSFIELHGGRVILDSRPDVGTTVTCLVPEHPPLTPAEEFAFLGSTKAEA